MPSSPPNRNLNLFQVPFHQGDLEGQRCKALLHLNTKLGHSIVEWGRVVDDVGIVFVEPLVHQGVHLQPHAKAQAGHPMHGHEDHEEGEMSKHRTNSSAETSLHEMKSSTGTFCAT